MGRLLAIGDVHGHPGPLVRLVRALGIRPTDTLVLLGDYIDRGPDSYGVLEVVRRLLRLPNVVAIRGNHEQMLVDAVAGRDPTWFGIREAPSTVRSYERAAPDGFLGAFLRKHFALLNQLPACVETPQFVFVHGGLDPNVPIAAQDLYDVIWRRTHDAAPHISGKIVVCGHTPTPDQQPQVIGGHTIAVDTGLGYPGGRLTGLDLTSGQYWQTDASGNLFRGRLAPTSRFVDLVPSSRA